MEVGQWYARNFARPRSGWEPLQNYLKTNQIRVPLVYSFDSTESLPIVDEGSIALEVNEGGRYGFVEYGQFTESSDGRTILDICKRVEDEFQVTLGCLAP